MAVSQRYLLDVNIWIALMDDAHIGSHVANDFLHDKRQKIASCPLVENGVVRIMNIPTYLGHGPVGFDAVKQQLKSIYAYFDYQFWGDSVSLLDDARFDFKHLQGHRQITDAYLLATAVANGGVFVTLDQNISLGSVKGAKKSHLLVLQ
jgi:uncharacterized protein